MPRETTRLEVGVTLVAALLALIAGLLGSFWNLKPLQPFTASSELTLLGSRPECGGSEPARIIFALKVPPTVTEEEPFLASLIATLENGAGIPGGGDLSRITARLSGVDMDIQPSAMVRLSRTGRAEWTVKPKSPGPRNLIVDIDAVNTPSEAAFLGCSTFNLSFMPGDPVLASVNVRSSWKGKAAKFWPYISFCLGSLLTVPGILAFSKERRERDKERNRIVSPRDFLK
jgi:hypothetical protein